MKKITLLSLTALAAVSVAFTKFETTSWTLDKTHARLSFAVSHMSISESEGAFKNFDIKITSSKEDFSDATVEMTADINSLDTDNEQRDAHLKAADFFDVAQFPTMTFKSKSLTKVAENKYKATGDLTLHGVTKPVTLDVVAKKGYNPYAKKDVAGFKITGSIKRSDFGIAPKMEEKMLGDEVFILCNAEFSKN